MLAVLTVLPVRCAPWVLGSLLLACGAGVTSASPAPQPQSANALPSPAADLATPGRAAAACARDAECGTHRCNVPAGKCAFPCATDADCAAGATCAHGAVGLCVANAKP